MIDESHRFLLLINIVYLNNIYHFYIISLHFRTKFASIILADF